jgi:RNA polymerase sigma-70 factor (ECF subfamily)
LAALIATARTAWPTLKIGTDTFLRHVAERAPVADDPAAVLRALSGSDLFLACGCVAGDPAFIAALEQQFLVPIANHVTRSGVSDLATADVLQELRTRLLVAPAGGVARIASYNGRGPLAGWIRVAAARVAVDMLRALKPDSVRRDDYFEIIAPVDDPELGFVKKRYRREFTDAFRETLAALSVRDANVLRLHYLEAVSAKSIGAIYGVTPRSVQQWIAGARRTILRRTRRLLADRLRLSSAQLDALMDLVQSQLDLSLHKFLGKAEEKAQK